MDCECFYWLEILVGYSFVSYTVPGVSSISLTDGHVNMCFFLVWYKGTGHSFIVPTSLYMHSEIRRNTNSRRFKIATG